MMLSANTTTAVLTNSELINKIPMAFATEPTVPMSERYVFIPTTTIIEDMAKMGWYPVLATGKGKRRNAKRKSSFHLIAFENDGDAYQILNSDGSLEAKVRIIVTNSHDGTSSFGFHIGIFRLICENGLVISTKTFSEIRVRHIHYTFEELRKVVATTTEQIPNEIRAFNAMREREMTDTEAKELALNAVKIRKGMELTDTLAVDEETINDLLTPQRDEDEGNDLWSIYNVLQEKVIKGGTTLAVDGKKPRKMRGIKSAIKDLNINKRLFETAYSYVGETEAA